MSQETVIELGEYFEQIPKPAIPVKVYPILKIGDYEKFLHSQFSNISIAPTQGTPIPRAPG